MRPRASAVLAVGLAVWLAASCGSPRPLDGPERPPAPAPAPPRQAPPAPEPDLTLGGVSAARLAEIEAAARQGQDPFEYRGAERLAPEELFAAGRFEKESRLLGLFAKTLYLVDLWIGLPLATRAWPSREALARAILAGGRHRLEIEKRSPVPPFLVPRLKADLISDLGQILERRRAHGREAHRQLELEVADFVSSLADNSGRFDVGARTVLHISEEAACVYFYCDREGRERRKPCLQRRYSGAFGRLLIEVYVLPAEEHLKSAPEKLLARVLPE